MGFSPLGLAVSVAVLAPNLLMLAFPPRTPMPQARIPAPLTWLERAGQALCLVVPAVTAAGELHGWWAVPAAAAVAIYWALWVRYLASDRRASALYRPLWRLPVPMAVLPVIAFAATAAWLSNGWIAVAAGILAAGHIPASVLTARAAN